jgi:lysophospholipase L1-like esterase
MVPLYEALRPLAKLWYAYSLGQGRDVPKPRDAPAVRSHEPDADRVLLLGNGPCHGWGVATHQLALAGALARAVERRTARGCDVDYVGNEVMNLASTLSWIGDRELSVYDTVVVVLGMNDAVRLTPLDRWTSGLEDLLDRLRERVRPEARILVAGLQPVGSVAVYEGIVSRVAQRHADRMNAATKRIVGERAGADFFVLPAPQPDEERPLGSPEMYREWARVVADWAAPSLEAVRAAGGARAAVEEREPEWTWSGAPRLLELAATGGSPAIRSIADEAKKRFKVQVAVVSLLEGDRLYYTNSTESLPMSIPRELSYCYVVSDEGSPVIVPDARRDPRFKGNPLIDLSHLIFYAGHPLKSSSGQTIGTFCLLGAMPRSASAIDMDALGELAQKAQAELWKMEPALHSPKLPA